MSTLAVETSWWGWVKGLWRRGGTASADVSRQIAPASRESDYALNAALYDNSIYDPQWLNQVLRLYFPKANFATTKIIGHFNPCKEIVDIYQNCLPGVWGEGIELAKTVDDEPVNPKLPPAVRRVWRDSNLDTAKTTIQQYAANYGTVGLRAWRPEGTEAAVVKWDHPADLFNIEEDDRGNVTAVTIKAKRPMNFSTDPENPDWQLVDVVEVITKDEFRFTRNGRVVLSEPNHYGFCPYVILRHSDNGTLFGDWAYKGSEPVIHAINFRISQQDRSLGRHMFPRWIFGAAGDKPVEIDIGETKATYIKLSNDGPNPFAQAIVPQINQAEAKDFWIQTIGLLRRRQPEMAVNDLQLYANISGETVAQVLKQAEQCVLRVRPAYDHAMIRVIQMAMSMGMEDGISTFDVGAGTGAGSADKAYSQGLETFAFASRPALPQTPAQQIAQANAAVADENARLGTAKLASNVGVDTQTTLETAGFDKAKVAEIIQRKRTQDPTLGTAL